MPYWSWLRILVGPNPALQLGEGSRSSPPVFPSVSVVDRDSVTISMSDCETPAFTASKLAAAVRRLPSGKSPSQTEASSFRLLCMLDSTGKLLERLILMRLSTFIVEIGGLAPNQFGFRPGIGTSDATRAVMARATFTASDKVRVRHLCTLVLLDVRNIFGSVP